MGYEEDYMKAKTTVWWDINYCCQLPKGIDGVSIMSTIRSALTAVGCCEGPVSVFICGDFRKLPRNIQVDLYRSNFTNVTLTLYDYSSAYFKDSHSFFQLYSMMYGWPGWANANANAPCNCMLISGDRYFSKALMDLRTENVNVLLAHPHLRVSKDLTEVADHVWLWNSLLAGEPPYKSIPAAAAASLDDEQPPSDGQETEPKKSSWSSPGFFLNGKKVEVKLIQENII